MKASRMREAEVLRQTALALRSSRAMARNHSHTVVFCGFRNAELAAKIRSQCGLSFTPGS